MSHPERAWQSLVIQWWNTIHQKRCFTSKYQVHRRVPTLHGICVMELDVPAFDTCFWHHNPPIWYIFNMIFHKTCSILYFLFDLILDYISVLGRTIWFVAPDHSRLFHKHTIMYYRYSSWLPLQHRASCKICYRDPAKHNHNITLIAATDDIAQKSTIACIFIGHVMRQTGFGFWFWVVPTYFTDICWGYSAGHRWHEQWNILEGQTGNVFHN